MLKSLFSSKTRVKLLSFFLLHSESEFFIRELTRKLKEQINSVRRELMNLKKLGLLKSRSKNHRKYYFVDPDFVFFDELKSIVLKATNPKEEIVKGVSRLGRVDFLLLTGVFTGCPDCPVDLLVVGEIDKSQLANFLENELTTANQVRFAHLTQTEFLHRLGCRDKFVSGLLNSDKKIVAVNKLEKVVAGKKA